MSGLLQFQEPSFTVNIDGRHNHGYLMSAELAEAFTRIMVTFPSNPPSVDQVYRLRDSSGRIYDGEAGEEQGNGRWSCRTWTFDRLADATTSISVEMALVTEVDVAPDSLDYALINGLVL